MKSLTASRDGSQLTDAILIEKEHWAVRLLRDLTLPKIRSRTNTMRDGGRFQKRALSLTNAVAIRPELAIPTKYSLL